MAYYKEALFEILRCDRLDVAKEIAADCLDVDLNDYIDEDDISTGSAYDFDDQDNINGRDVLSEFE